MTASTPYLTALQIAVEKASEYGYAVAMFGDAGAVSLTAIPWQDNAAPVADVLAAVSSACGLELQPPPG